MPAFCAAPPFGNALDAIDRRRPATALRMQTLKATFGPGALPRHRGFAHKGGGGRRPRGRRRGYRDVAASEEDFDEEDYDDPRGTSCAVQ